MDASASIGVVRETLADVVDRAIQDEPTIITRRGREVAAVVSIEVLRQWHEWDEARTVALVAQRSGEPTYPMSQVLAEVVDG